MAKDQFTKQWITENAVEICSRYSAGVLTLRSLHYQLVGLGMTNDIQHYKRVVDAMIDARWAGIIRFEQFSDLDRTMEGVTNAEPTILENEIEKGKNNIEAWMKYYSKNRWENQPIYPEVFIEKKALQGVFQIPCERAGVALGACKGYPSLTFLYEASKRFKKQIDRGKQVVILYFGDYDPSGEDIPRSIQENFNRFGVELEVIRIALMEHQVEWWKLPPAPAKQTDKRTAAWGGLGQVELDAVKPEKLVDMVKDSIANLFNEDLHEQLMEKERDEQKQYRRELRDYVQNKTFNEDE